MKGKGILAAILAALLCLMTACAAGMAARIPFPFIL